MYRPACLPPCHTSSALTVPPVPLLKTDDLVSQLFAVIDEHDVSPRVPNPPIFIGPPYTKLQQLVEIVFAVSYKAKRS